MKRASLSGSEEFKSLARVAIQLIGPEGLEQSDVRWMPLDEAKRFHVVVGSRKSKRMPGGKYTLRVEVRAFGQDAVKVESAFTLAPANVRRFIFPERPAPRGQGNGQVPPSQAS